MQHLITRPRRIVLTGGPAAGKTILCTRLAGESPDVFIHVSEAATQVYDRLGTRWDRLDSQGRRDVQRRIYQLQNEQEAAIASRSAGKVLLLDRGSVDGAAYWPGGPDDYWLSLNTTHAAELSRYDAVIWLESCAVIGAYDGDASNPCRFESAADAIATGNRLKAVWQPHPNFHHVKACPHIEEKIIRVRELLGTFAAHQV